MTNTGDWSRAGRRYYRRVKYYDFKLPRIGGLFTVSPLGGSLAISQNGVVQVFSPAGVLLAAWPAPTDLVHIMFSPYDNIVAITQSGKGSLLRACSGALVYAFSVPVGSSGIALCESRDSTMLVLGNTGSLYSLFIGESSVVVHGPSIPRPPAHPALLTLNEHCIPMIIIQGSLFVLDSMKNDWIRYIPSEERITLVKMSPSGKLLALVSDTGNLAVMRDEERILDCLLPDDRTPYNMAWLNDEAVVLAWPGSVMLIDIASNEFVAYTGDGHGNEIYQLSSDPGGVRVISEDSYDFIYRIPDATVGIFEIGSCTPASLLLDAADAMVSSDPGADATMREISSQDSLHDAVVSCIESAMDQLDINLQRNLLKAAAYGKLFLRSFDTDEYVEACKKLRVINTLRQHGIPLTSIIYDRLGSKRIISRLLESRQYDLALGISSFLGCDILNVVMHWARALVSSAEPSDSDEHIAKVLCEKLSSYTGVSYSSIAAVAFKKGRRKLACLLIEQEENASEQVPLLLKMGLENEALVKACSSGDTDLVNLAILGLLNRDESLLFSMLINSPLARALFISYCQSWPESLQRLYEYLHEYSHAAIVILYHGYLHPTPHPRIRTLDIANKVASRKPYSNSSLFVSKICQQQTDLLVKWPRIYRRVFPKDVAMDNYLNYSSVNQILELLITENAVREADQFRKEFNVPDKRYTLIQIRVYCNLRQFTKLLELSNLTRTACVGLVPFVEACIDGGAISEAQNYIHRLKEPHERMSWYCAIGQWGDAIEVAVQESDLEALYTLQSRCKDSSLLEKIEGHIQNITS